jgi:hypothetical protein
MNWPATLAGIEWPSSEPVLDLPSWVPDFRGSEARSPSLHEFQADQDSLPVVSYSEDLEVLIARGVVYYTIKDIDYHDEGSKVAKAFWQDLALSQPGLHPTGMPYLQAYFRTMVTDNPGKGYGKKPFRDEETERL